MRTIPSDVFQANAIVDLLVKFQWSYISVIASDDSYGRAGSAYLFELLKLKNICVGVQALIRSRTVDSESIKVITKLKNHPRVNVIVCMGFTSYIHPLTSAS